MLGLEFDDQIVEQSVARDKRLDIFCIPINFLAVAGILIDQLGKHIGFEWLRNGRDDLRLALTLGGLAAMAQFCIHPGHQYQRQFARDRVKPGQQAGAALKEPLLVGDNDIGGKGRGTIFVAGGIDTGHGNFALLKIVLQKTRERAFFVNDENSFIGHGWTFDQ